MLDRDLAQIYDVPTKAFNQAVKRNADRFPEDFMFRLTKEEAEGVRVSRSQIVTLKRGQNVKYLPYAFTEYGALMAANIGHSRPRSCQLPSLRLRLPARLPLARVLNSARAVADEYDVRGRRWMDCIVRLGNGRAIGRARVSIFVVRAFAKMREALLASPQLAKKLAALEKKLTARLDVHESAIVQVLQEVMQILNPPPLPPSPPKPRIGFTPGP